MSATAYPLAWPAHVPRTPPAKRKAASFRHYGQPLTVASALERLKSQVDLLRGKDGRRPQGLVVSTDMELRRDGFPRSDRTPADPGVAVYFYLDGKSYCLPCDSWTRAPDNIGAVAWHIDATRAIERYGVGTVEQAFTGFLYLPAPSWWSDLGLKAKPPTLAEAEAAWRRFIKEHHPDLGGDKDLAALANQAIADARREMS